MKIEFTILGECCSMKNSRELVTLPRFSKKKQKIIPMAASIKGQKAREYEKSASLQIPAEARQMLTGPVRVTLRLYYASQRPDLDGALLLDIMAAKYKRMKGKLQKIGNGEYRYADGERVLISKGVYINDRQCREIHQYHGIDKANPRAEIEIEPMQAQQCDLLDEAELIEESAPDESEVPF